jgi:hypothetical protein
VIEEFEFEDGSSTGGPGADMTGEDIEVELEVERYSVGSEQVGRLRS